MGCCGQKRAALSNAVSRPTIARATVSAPSAPAPPAAAPAPGGTSGLVAGRAVRLRYLARSPVQVRGAVTGRHYHFSASVPEQFVDARDAGALLATRFFRRA